MKVQLGFSAELKQNAWRKVDIEVDEVDLQRIINEHPWDVSGPVRAEKLTTSEAFALLEAEADRLLVIEMLTLGALTQEVAVKQIGDDLARQKKVLDGL